MPNSSALSRTVRIIYTVLAVVIIADMIFMRAKVEPLQTAVIACLIFVPFIAARIVNRGRRRRSDQT